MLPKFAFTPSVASAARRLAFGMLVMLAFVPENAMAAVGTTSDALGGLKGVTTGVSTALPGATTTDATSGTTTGTNPTTTSAASASNTVSIGDKNPLCNQAFATAFDKARQTALTVQLSRDSEFFKYQIAGAFAANCVGKLVGYANSLADAVGQVQTAATAGTPVQAVVTLIAHRILSAVLRQIISNLENQICSITTQLTSAMESVVQNAICIPSGALNIGGIGNFNLNLNLPNLQCDGLAIPLTSFAQIDPATGQPFAQGESTYTAGALSTYGTGGFSANGSYDAPPLRADGYDYVSGTSGDIYGEPMTTGWDEITTPVASGSVGSVCSGGGDVTSFVNALGARESGNGKSADCQHQSRIGVSGQSTSQYTCVNYAGFMGKYQFGEAVLHDLQVRGALPSYASSFGDCRPYPSRECMDQRYSNANALIKFMNDPAAQEAAIRAELDMNWAILKKRGAEALIGKTINGVLITKSGLLAAAHLIGAPGLMNAIANGKLTADGNGVQWIDYAKLFSNC